MLPRRITALAIAILAALAAFWCVRDMSARIRLFLQEHPPNIYAFLPLLAREFTFADRTVSLTDESPPGKPATLLVRYGDAEVRVPVTIPPRHKLPGLVTHEDWLRVMLFAPRSGMTMEAFEEGVRTGKIETRLAIVSRTPPEGFDPEGWGAVRKKDWTFDFWELKTDGSIEHKTLKYPTARGLKEPRPGELHENTWEFQAALLLMPNAGKKGPTHNFYGDALSAAGWRLPASAFCGLIATVALAFAAAPASRGGGFSWRTGRTPGPVT
ncbi:MAG: hypothetical protein DYG92_04340 [Leptolyngbya sp. PLA1]|nr:hypothetical protein [Leptolyngbya sp. PLA1]